MQLGVVVCDQNAFKMFFRTLEPIGTPATMDNPLLRSARATCSLKTLISRRTILIAAMAPCRETRSTDPQAYLRSFEHFIQLLAAKEQRSGPSVGAMMSILIVVALF